jgi:hypothetical protein
MMSADTVALAWLPHHGGQNHECTDIVAYYDHDQHDQRNPGDHRDAPKSARPERVGPVSLVHIRSNARRRS